MNNKHLEERSFERYNVEISAAEEKQLIDSIKNREILYIGKSEKDDSRHFAYVKLNHIPFKVLYHKSKRKHIHIVTVYPFDADEYNSLLAAKQEAKINSAINLLKREGYIVYRRKKKNEHTGS